MNITLVWLLLFKWSQMSLSLQSLESVDADNLTSFQAQTLRCTSLCIESKGGLCNDSNIEISGEKLNLIFVQSPPENWCRVLNQSAFNLMNTKWTQTFQCRIQQTIENNLMDTLGYICVSKNLDSSIKFLDDGRILTRISGNHTMNPQRFREFCLEKSSLDGSYVVKSYQKRCFNSFKHRISPTFLRIYIPLLGVGSMILLITILVTLSLWNEQNLHRWIMFAQFLCLFFCFSLYALNMSLMLYEDPKNYLRTPGCIAVGIGIHFFVIATITWMSIMSFDVWSTLRNVTPLKRRQNHFKGFLQYCPIGYGVPSLVVGTSIFIECRYELFDDRIIRPHYGCSGCELDTTAVAYYSGIPALVLLAINLVFATMTGKILWSLGRQKLQILGNGTKISAENIITARRFGKIFLMTGISWAAYVIGCFTDGTGVTALSASFDFYNIIQAVIFAYFYAFTKNMRTIFFTKYPRLHLCGGLHMRWMQRLTRWSHQVSQMKDFEEPNSIADKSDRREGNDFHGGIYYQISTISQQIDDKY